MAPTRVYFIPTPIGDHRSDFSVAGLRALEKLEHLFVEDVPEFIAHMRDSNVFTDRHRLHMIGASSADDAIALVDAGTPFAIMAASGLPGFIDPGHEIAAALLSRALDRVELVPIGMSSALDAALCITGIDVRGFVFLGHFPEHHLPIEFPDDPRVPVVAFVRGEALAAFGDAVNRHARSGALLVLLREIRKKGRSRVTAHPAGPDAPPLEDDPGADYVAVVRPPQPRWLMPR